MATAKDLRRLALALEGTTEGVVVWDLDPGHQFDFACRIAGRDLTENEWRTYLAAMGEPRRTCGFDSVD